MEFQCRLGTPHGEVIEGVYVAEDEARLRHDLEEKGLLVLDLRPKGALALPGLPTFRRRRRVSSIRSARPTPDAALVERLLVRLAMLKRGA